MCPIPLKPPTVPELHHRPEQRYQVVGGEGACRPQTYAVIIIIAAAAAATSADEAAAAHRPTADDAAAGAGSCPAAPAAPEASALERHQPVRGGAMVQLGQGERNSSQLLR